MYTIKVKDILDNDLDAVRVVVTDIERPVEAWKLVENLACSYFDHGLDRTKKAYWFKDRSGLHYIWAERQKPVEADDVSGPPERAPPPTLYQRTERLLHS